MATLSAVAANTISKIAIGVMIGRGRFALEIIAMALACIAAGAIALWMTLAILIHYAVARSQPPVRAFPAPSRGGGAIECP
jgi:hypothetical protein